jgi:hypothetical protein
MNCSRKRCVLEATLDSHPGTPLCTKHNRALLRRTGAKLLPRKAELRPAPPEQRPCGRCGVALKAIEAGRLDGYDHYRYQVGSEIKMLCPACWRAVTA